MFGSVPEEKAYIAPFAVFLGFLALAEFVGKIFDGIAGPWWLSEPRLWVFPLQTLVCGWLVARWWRFYDLKKPSLRALAFATGVGVLVLVIWIAPQQWLGVAARRDGFDPTYFGSSGWPFVVTVALRFIRLAVVVPLVEEIFWRGYLLRVFVDDPFENVRIGAFSWLSFGIVTAGFCLEHQLAVWPAAIAAGALYNLVAYRTHSLTACVVAHAITNLLLGIFVMRSGQWGFW
jgi:CAAX prenyl protease-like protein